jgi:L-amino acid N-acyltransferase YncA
MEITFKEMEANDWESVAEIYKQGIETGNATFQQEIPTWNDWDSGHLKSCRIVACVQNEIVGWAALSSVSTRKVYAGVAEVSVYVSNKYRGYGIGYKLLERMIAESESENFWTLQAGIFPENYPSLHIHKKLNFREIGYRERIGKMDGIWRNTVLLERRSAIVGLD